MSEILQMEASESLKSFEGQSWMSRKCALVFVATSTMKDINSFIKTLGTRRYKLSGSIFPLAHRICVSLFSNLDQRHLSPSLTKHTHKHFVIQSSAQAVRYAWNSFHKIKLTDVPAKNKRFWGIFSPEILNFLHKQLHQPIATVVQISNWKPQHQKRSNSGWRAHHPFPSANCC